MDFPQFRKLVAELRLGKHLRDAVYLHQSALVAASPELAVLTEKTATALKLDWNAWNVAKFSRRDFKLTLLHYPGFDTYAYPALAQSHTVSLEALSVRTAEYSTSDNPPILHRKEAFVAEDDPRRALFEAITQEGEAAGLYENTRSIGFKKNWERLIRTKGYFLDESGRLHPQEAPESESPATALSANDIQRHKTAIDRNKLSAPMQVLARHGYFDGIHSVLDYGCGKGDDVRELEAHGVSVSGWDPAHRPDGERTPSDLVNLGYVLNVIEDLGEREDTLRQAYQCANKLLIVSAMVAGESTVRQFKPYKDGVITSRNTFQRYYAQAEFKEFLKRVLSETPIAVGPGIFILFKDKLEEQRFLLERQHVRRNWRQLTQREVQAPAQPIAKGLLDKHKELFDHFWETTLDLGRLPANSEFEHSERLRRVAGSHKKAFEALKEHYGDKTFAAAQTSRRNDLLVYFALAQFEQRTAYRDMPESLKRDIKAFFGKYPDAVEEATTLLFSVGRPEVIEQKAEGAFVKDQIGEFNEGHSWIIPKALLPELPPELRIYVGCATQLYGDLEPIHLIKIHFTSGKVSLLRYDDFSKETPLLVQRIKIKLRELEVDFFEYGGEFESTPLTEKSRYFEP